MAGCWSRPACSTPCCGLARVRPSRGEFTLRAFLNGRLDLAQAEAVADLVAAPTGRGAGRRGGSAGRSPFELRARAAPGLPGPDGAAGGRDRLYGRGRAGGSTRRPAAHAGEHRRDAGGDPGGRRSGHAAAARVPRGAGRQPERGQVVADERPARHRARHRDRDSGHHPRRGRGVPSTWTAFRCGSATRRDCDRPTIRWSASAWTAAARRWPRRTWRRWCWMGPAASWPPTGTRRGRWRRRGKRAIVIVNKTDLPPATTTNDAAGLIDAPVCRTSAINGGRGGRARGAADAHRRRRAQRRPRHRGQPAPQAGAGACARGAGRRSRGGCRRVARGLHCHRPAGARCRRWAR